MIKFRVLLNSMQQTIDKNEVHQSVKAKTFWSKTTFTLAQLTVFTIVKTIPEKPSYYCV